MEKRTDSRNLLRFENVEKLDGEFSPAPSAFSPDKHELGLETYKRYFLEYKKSLIAFSLITFIGVFLVFQNKDYHAKVGFKVEPGQDLTSNILSESLLGVKPAQNSLGNITERALVKAKSVGFYDELALAILSNKEYQFIRFKLGEERKGWLEFLKKTVFRQDGSVQEDYIRNRISEHLEKVVSVEKGTDNNIFFGITTKNKDLTKEILLLLKNKAGSLMIKDPLREAAGALEILEQTEQKIFLELDQLGEQVLALQKKHNTLIPQELPERYSSMRLEVEKSILENLVKEKTLLSKYRKLADEKKSQNAFSYDLKKEMEGLNKELSATRGATSLLKQKLKSLNEDFKDLPIFSSEVEKIHFRKKILLEKLHKLTEQISLAKISLEKVRSALNNLNLNERINQTGTLKILSKTILTSITIIIAALAGLYYKQSLFPKLMRKEDLDQSLIPVAATFPKTSVDEFDLMGDGLANPRLQALGAFYHNWVKGKRWFTVAPVSSEGGFDRDLKDLVSYLLKRGQKVCLYNLSTKNFGKKHFTQLLEDYPATFNMETPDSCEGQAKLADKKAIRKFLNSRAQDELVFICAPDFETSPNAIILSQITDSTFAMARLFSSSAHSIRKLLKQRAYLPPELREKFLFVLGNALPYDDINTYVQTNFKSGERNENQSARLKIG